MISIGLVGCGAVVHLSYARILRGREAYGVKWVCDLDASQAESAASIFGAEVVTLDEIAKRADAVIVSTPPSSHAALVEACLREDRIILCEKPYMASSEEARTIDAKARAAGAHLSVGHFRRTYPQLELARDLIASGVLGTVEAFSAFEGGRFTWRSVSDYPVRDPNGGVLWDTGSHTLDMALFATGLDLADRFSVSAVSVQKDKPEPSHDFAATFVVAADDASVAGRVHLSRRDALPNYIEVVGSRGKMTFMADLDDRVRITSGGRSTVIRASQSYSDFIECFDLQARRVLLRDRPEDFAAARFIGQVTLLEALANA